ncbi:MAG: fasciclin domain-containing protein [Myxococcota bacterium]
MRLTILKGVVTALAVATLATACGDDDDEDPTPTPTSNTTVVDLAVNDTEGRFTILAQALTDAGLVDTLTSAGPFTVFAPTDDAFMALPGFDTLTADQISDVLTYHVISGSQIMASMITDGATPATVETSNLTLNLDGNTVVIDGLTQVTQADLTADNGVVHVIDSVLLPPSIDFPGSVLAAAVYYPRLSTLQSAVEAAPAAVGTALDTVTDITLFAPTDSAFGKIPTADLNSLLNDAAALTSTLQYHVLPANPAGGTFEAADILAAANANGLSEATVSTLEGPRVRASTANGVQVNDSNVIFTDVTTSNGTIHLIDTVLSVPGTIAEIAAATEDLSILVEALGDNTLVATLGGDNGGNGFTVFAPTNAAFEALGFSAMSDLSGLGEILLNHVIDGEVDANAAVGVATGNMPMVETRTNLADDMIELSATNTPALFIDGRVQVVTTNIVASNGIVHVVDAVVLPAFDTITGTLAALPRFSTLVGAVTTQRLDESDGTSPLLSTVLAGDDWTVFAPTDEAFASFGTLPTDQALSDVLLYHVAPDVLDAEAIVTAAGMSGTTVATALTGESVSASVSGGTVTLDGDVTVILTDIPTTNGVIHVIDDILVPAP